MKRILLTNNTLAARAGSELYVRDVARELLAREWSPIAYSNCLGDVAQELRALSIPVVDDLSKISEPPDLIHGHHHLDTATAIAHFPGVPVVHFCHGWLPWQEAPLRHPQIKRYIAVDALCRERLVSENGVPSEEVEVLLNFVNMERFLPRPPLPEKPKRALVFSNSLGPQSAQFQSIENACAQLGMTVEIVGAQSGHATSEPERMLQDFDVVFAKARCALEALATGCAVIVCDFSGFAGMVTPERYPAFRDLNFGYRLLQRCRRPSTAQVLDELQLYNAFSCQDVSRTVRREADLRDAMDRLTGIYEDVMTRFPKPHPPATSEDKAFAAYMAKLSKLVKDGEALASRAHSLDSELTNARDEISRLRAQSEEKSSQLSQAQTELHSLRAATESHSQRAALLQSKLNDLRSTAERRRGFRKLLPDWILRKSKAKAP